MWEMSTRLGVGFGDRPPGLGEASLINFYDDGRQYVRVCQAVARLLSLRLASGAGLRVTQEKRRPSRQVSGSRSTYQMMGCRYRTRSS